MTKIEQTAFAVITGLIVAGTTTATAAPCLSWLDAGDFVTASRTLGIPHPTGFPLYTVLGHLLTYLPFGNIASRVALLSSFAIGWTCFCLALLAARYAATRLEALATSVVLVAVTFASPIVFLSARVPEVYGVHCALTASSLVCLDSLYRTADLRSGYLLAVVIALGLGNHALFRLLSIGFVLFLFPMRSRLNGLFVLSSVLLAMLGLLAYLYLPVAALGKPAHNWGDPSTFQRFWAHINAADIRAAYQNEMTPSLFRLITHLKQYLQALWSSLGPLLWAGGLSLAACLFLFHKHHKNNGLVRLGSWLFVLVAAETVYAVAINPMGLGDLQNGQFSVLALSGAGTMSTVIILRKAAELTPRLRHFIALAGIALFLGSLLPSISHDYWDIRQDWTAEDLAVAHTAQATPSSMTVLVTDSMIGAHLYAQIVLDARPDTAIFGRNQAANGERFAYMARGQPFPILDETLLLRWAATKGMISEKAFQSRMEELVRTHYGIRPIYWEETVLLKDLSEEYTTSLTWPIGRLLKTASATEKSLCGDPNRSFCREPTATGFQQSALPDSSQSMYYRSWLAERWALVGKRLLRKGESKKAAAFFATAMDLAPQSAAWKTNLAVCLARMGKLKEALQLTLSALEQNPLAKVAVKNGLLYARTLKDETTTRYLENHARNLQIAF